MKFIFSHVVPTEYLYYVHCTGSALLAEGSKLLNDKSYFNFFKKIRPFIVDQSCVFGDKLSVNDYVQLIRELRPLYCFAPDVIGDLSSTLSRFEEFNKERKSLPSTPVYILQGRNAEEMLQCLDRVLEFEGDFVIGITSRYPVSFLLPERTTSYDMGTDRQLFIKEVMLYLGAKAKELRFYLPGVWALFEVLTLPDVFIACDSSICFQSAMLGKSVLLSRRTMRPIDWNATCDDTLLLQNVLAVNMLVNKYRNGGKE